MKLIDSHAHLTFEPLAEAINAVLDRSIAAGVDGWITVGTDSKQNEQIISILDKHPNLFGTVGIHPHYAKDVSDSDVERMRLLAENEKIIAIGETGLDFHYNFSKQDAQIELFKKQLAIASDTNLPLIIHSRNAFDKTIKVLDEFSGSLGNIVFHCFGGDATRAKFILDRGYYISFTGMITFKSADSAREAAAVVPLDRMMVETDCPYMSPAPMRKQKINEPALMIHTAKKLAEIKGVGYETFCKSVTENTKRFFGI
ncbi:MAG: TatD family hydrolase [Anaerohalosphaeraceae bacterium]|nr:TatD family hydrolase [Anaerohalosphaeraceae bacterium]